MRTCAWRAGNQYAHQKSSGILIPALRAKERLDVSKRDDLLAQRGKDKSKDKSKDKKGNTALNPSP